VKTTFFAAALVVAFTLSAAAAQKPPVSHHLAGSLVEAPQFSGHSVPPVLCDPCLFYGGDLNPADFNAAGMSDENTLLISGGNTYGNFNVASGATFTVTGILFNVQADADFDPLTATYDVRTGVIEGNGGTSIASGSGNVAVVATGRNFLGLNEYSLVVQLATPLTLGPGGYWFNMTPSCTNGAQDGSCFVGRFFVSNTTTRVNAIRGTAQPIHEMFFNSSFFGFTFANWCDSSVAGFNPIQCGALSFGLLGQ
jgi:hypothetical protein